jgi:glycosyltransferase involved in cell wall biosynthesis
VLRSAKAVVVPSQTLESIAMQRWKLPAARVHWIPNGIDPTGFPTQDGNKELRAAFDIPEDVFLIGSVGHLRAEKNLARLLNACARLDRDTHVLVVGDGPQRGMLEARASQRDLAGRVHFAGHREDLGELYRAMDVFAMSSDTEQMPVALLESMCAGLPVVATDVGDITRILPPEGREYIVSLEEDPVTTLAAALDKLGNARYLRRTLGVANRLRVSERFTFAGMVDAYRRLYLEGSGGK